VRLAKVLQILAALLRREKEQSLDQIVAVNLLLGWTIIGWLVALVLASSKGRKLP
jgi:Superinfection immunity protein